MARGSIAKRILGDGSVRYDVIVDLGPDSTHKRRQRKKTFARRKDAHTWLTEQQANIDKGMAVDRSRQTVADTLAYWLNTYARYNVRPGTLEGYEITIRVHILPALGAIPVQKLTAADLQSFYTDKLVAGIGPRTVELCHMRLSQALDQAVSLGLLARNVTDLVKPPRVEHKEMQIWDVGQARRFLEVAPRSSYGPIWQVALATGMRRGELLGLRWQDIDFDRAVLSIRQTVGVLRGGPEIKPPKSKSSSRKIPIGKEIVSVLRRHKAIQNERRLVIGYAWRDHDLVFAAANGMPINPNNLKRDFDCLIALAGVPRIRIHDQRHTHITFAIQTGGSIIAVSNLAGHAYPSITVDNYGHALPGQHEDIVNKVDSLLFGAILEDAGEQE